MSAHIKRRETQGDFIAERPDEGTTSSRTQPVDIKPLAMLAAMNAVSLSLVWLAENQNQSALESRASGAGPRNPVQRGFC